MRDNTNPNFSFALDFSPKREINKVTFASFQPDNDDHILENYCDNNDDCDNIDSFNEEEDEEEITFRSQDNLINTNENCFNKFPSKSDHSQIENESIPKMQLNMFIQKDGKQSGSKKWPKVETPFCRQNKIAEVMNIEQVPPKCLFDNCMKII